MSRPFLWIALLSLVLSACGGSPYIAFKTHESQTRAATHQLENRQNEIENELTLKADSLFTRAGQLLQKEETDQALNLYDRADLLYRLALVRKHNELIANELSYTSGQLDELKAELDLYKKVLNRLQTEKAK